MLPEQQMTESEQEARDERRAIMACEGIAESDILALFKKRPDIFGYDDINEVQDSIFAPATTQAL